MKWFDNWFANKVASSIRKYNEPTPEIYSSTNKVSIAADSPESSNHLYFKIFPASGGFVIEYKTRTGYSDNLTKSSNSSSFPSLTVVNKAEDIGETVQRIVITEALKR